MVIPRSRSSEIESMVLSWEREFPHCLSNLSMRVVFPWSTCAITARFRMLLILVFSASMLLSGEPDAGDGVEQKNLLEEEEGGGAALLLREEFLS